ncbi:MAG: choline-sulfatase [Gemmatimonadetes bacterium]|nr:choline-sulfatase [Gemmatimonadota bacterium]HCK08389.1 choline-sulfatase [Candidatus Latescibacterota bacterium]
MKKPNVLFVMTDQQRWDTIAALGNGHIYTPNMDRLVRRGVSFNWGYSSCPVCVAARYTVRTGCEPLKTRRFSNGRVPPIAGQSEEMTDRCGPYIAQTMRSHGYRTFGIGKFHTGPWNEDIGYDVHLHSEEMYRTPEQRAADGYAGWIAREHPEFDYIEALQGERTEMYYMPQVSPLPAHLTVEAWAADRAVEQIRVDDERPYFGFVSFIGPHPPFAPPVPFNRMYDPDRMPNPIYGEIETDHADEQIPYMNRIIWADDITDSHARVLKARYYGEISYIDDCLGRILDTVESRKDADNTVICFFSDHGEHLGDHRAWQKESFFDASNHIPFLVSWPTTLPKDQRRDELVCLTDLFAIATGAAGQTETRDGSDVLGVLIGDVDPREHVIGWYGVPGKADFKVMVRHGESKYIYLANGGREQLFNLVEDPQELRDRSKTDSDVLESLREIAISQCEQPEAEGALENGTLKAFPFTPRERNRIYQFDLSRGVAKFPERPEDALKSQVV